MRSDDIRSEVQRLIHQAPFRPFALNLENGDRVPVGHPENIAFDAGNGTGTGSFDFYVISGRLRVFGTFEAVTSVATPEAVDRIVEPT